LADGTVTRELVSGRISLISRENTGNFRDFGAFDPDVSRQPYGFIKFFEQIPYATKQGIS
jgi:hypothetical protein